MFALGDNPMKESGSLRFKIVLRGRFISAELTERENSI